MPIRAEPRIGTSYGSANHNHVWTMGGGVAKTIGIRREEKNRWERRAPLTPEDVGRLIRAHGLEFRIQPSPSPEEQAAKGLPARIFPDEAYAQAGARIQDDLSTCDLVLGVKEIPADVFRKGGAYLFFSHTIKCQRYNMPMMKRMLDLGCTLFDYELIADEQKRRKVFFGRHAGLAGMIDTLCALGLRLKVEGIETPFAAIKMAHEYGSLAEAQADVLEAGGRINALGFDERIMPVVIGFSGYGNVSKGAQEIIDLLPTHEITAEQLMSLHLRGDLDNRHVYKVEFKEEDMFVPKEPGATFDLQHYFAHPDAYRSMFDLYTPHLTALVNAIFWTEQCPRLVTKSFLRELYGGAQPKLRVIGDISCDLEGSIEATIKTTMPDAPCFVYDAATDSARDGYEGRGPVIMAVDNLPCELPLESTQHFSTSLRDFVAEFARADITTREGIEALSYPLRRSLIAFQGQLEPEYRYIEACIRKAT